MTGSTYDESLSTPPFLLSLGHGMDDNDGCIADEGQEQEHVQDYE